MRGSNLTLTFGENLIYDNTSFINSLKSAIEDYYESQLGLNTSEYYYLNESVQKDYYIEFGILQCPTDTKEK